MHSEATRQKRKKQQQQKKPLHLLTASPFFVVTKTFSPPRIHFKIAFQTLENVPELQSAQHAERKER